MFKIGLREVLFLVILGLAGAFIVAQGAEPEKKIEEKVESSVSIVVAGEDGEVIMESTEGIDPGAILDMLPAEVGEAVEAAVGQALIVAEDRMQGGKIGGDRPPAEKKDDNREDRKRNYMEAMRKRMADMQKRREESLRKRLGATEEEWKVLYPRIKKVQDLQAAQGMGGYGGMMVMRYSSRSRETSPVRKAEEKLRNLLKEENPAKGAIKTALEDLRDAKQQDQKKLTDARKELREIITIKQEAILVQMGILD